MACGTHVRGCAQTRSCVGILASREAEGRCPRRGRPTGVFPVWPTHLRSRQAGDAVGAGGLGRPAGADLPGVPSGARGLGRGLGPVPRLWRNAPVGTARGSGVPRVRSHGARVERGRLAQLAERRPYKAKVGGSNPSAPTNLELTDIVCTSGSLGEGGTDDRAGALQDRSQTVGDHPPCREGERQRRAHVSVLRHLAGAVLHVAPSLRRARPRGAPSALTPTAHEPERDER
jgi:hypothetical protein